MGTFYCKSQKGRNHTNQASHVFKRRVLSMRRITMLSDFVANITKPNPKGRNSFKLTNYKKILMIFRLDPNKEKNLNHY